MINEQDSSTLNQGLENNVNKEEHGLIQQGVWVPFWTPRPLKRTPQDTQIF